MPRTKKVADVYQKRGEIHKKEKTIIDKLFEFIGGVIVLIIAVMIIGAIV